ncbi:hypothetical protein WJX72_001136 [[Myrmecia] bisecta]|uniref:Elongation factor 1-gamma n=1 Tax=[Myrmecia] bisecta TaxID=41462 RepID=A0AAW1P8X8_9CHLO
MSGLKLYTPANNKNAYKALIAAEIVGVKVEVVGVQMGVDNKTPEFLKKNPNGKVPTLDTPNGSVWESNAIARYVARQADKGLFGDGTTLQMAQVEQWIDFSTGEIDAPLLSWVYPLFGFWPYDKKAQVEQWIDFSTGEIDAPLASWIYPLFGYATYDKQKEDAAKAAVSKALNVLEGYLATRTYLVGDAITLADVITTCNLYHGFSKVFDPEFRKPFPNVTRYFTTCVNQPAFKRVIKEVELCKEPMKLQAQAAPAADAKKEAPKAASPAKPAAKKEAAPAAAAPAAEEDKPAPKPKNPLDALPPSKMILDSWKRLYSNTPGAKFRDIACKGLWEGADIPNSPNQEHFEGYDPAGYTIYFCDYKYPEENTVNYIVMNKVGGFLQRIDYVRKYAFGVMCILKDSNGQFPIRGFWIFRGQGIPPIMLEECYDMELYNWTKVDPSDKAAKARIEDMLCEEAKIDGLEHVECKVFK